MLQPIQKLSASIITVIDSASLTNGDRVPFPDVPQLRNNNIVGMSTYTGSNIGATPNGQTVTSLFGMAFIYVTLIDHTGYAFIKQVPLLLFAPLEFQQMIRQFLPKRKVNLEQSYLEAFPTGGGTISGAYVFTFFYEPYTG